MTSTVFRVKENIHLSRHSTSWLTITAMKACHVKPAFRSNCSRCPALSSSTLLVNRFDLEMTFYFIIDGRTLGQSMLSVHNYYKHMTTRSLLISVSLALSQKSAYTADCEYCKRHFSHASNFRELLDDRWRWWWWRRWWFTVNVLCCVTCRDWWSRQHKIFRIDKMVENRKTSRRTDTRTFCLVSLALTLWYDAMHAVSQTVGCTPNSWQIKQGSDVVLRQCSWSSSRSRSLQSWCWFWSRTLWFCSWSFTLGVVSLKLFG